MLYCPYVAPVISALHAFAPASQTASYQCQFAYPPASVEVGAFTEAIPAALSATCMYKLTPPFATWPYHEFVTHGACVSWCIWCPPVHVLTFPALSTALNIFVHEWYPFSGMKFDVICLSSVPFP